jgi:NADP-dependent 3-hydroxy acid dehydrogenase YdfG
MASSDIAGKIVVITGASSGMGESTARLLAAQGAKVIVGARRADRIDSLVRDISAAGARRSERRPTSLCARTSRRWCRLL